MNIYFSSALINVKQLEELTNVGFQGWEVIAEGPQKLDKDLISLIEYAESSYDLGISVHTPFSDLNIASLNPPIWQETLGQIEAVIEGLADHAHIFVIHPGYISPLAAFCPEKALDKNKQALIRLVHMLKSVKLKRPSKIWSTLTFCSVVFLMKLKLCVQMAWGLPLILVTPILPMR